MGVTKKVSEMICQSISKEQKDTTFSIVRFGNVIGSSGSVIPKFEQQINNGGPLTVTHKKVTRYFMTIKEAAGLVIQAGALGRSGEIFVLDIGEPVKIFDLAKKMISLLGFTPTLENSRNPKKIKIEFIGLRPGEKIHEELFINKNIYKTKHPRIFKTNEKSMQFNKLRLILSKLEKSCQQKNFNKLKILLKNISSDFKI